MGQNKSGNRKVKALSPRRVTSQRKDYRSSQLQVHYREEYGQSYPLGALVSYPSRSISESVLGLDFCSTWLRLFLVGVQEIFVE